MAQFGKRSYKKAAGKTAPAKTYKRAPRPENPPDEREEREERPARSGGRGGYRGGGRGSYGRGGGGGGGRGRSRDDSFIHVTGLFEGKSKKSFTVFVKPEMLDKLAEVQEGDLLGVSYTDYGMSLWFKKPDD